MPTRHLTSLLEDISKPYFKAGKASKFWLLTNAGRVLKCVLASISFVALVCCLPVTAQEPNEKSQQVPKGLMGDWALDLDSSEPAWLSVFEQNGKPMVRMRVYIGTDGPFKITKVENGRIHFPIKRLGKKKSKFFTNRTVDVGLKEGKLNGIITHEPNDGSQGKKVKFTGERVPAMPNAPDLSEVRFGHPITLFNGKDLTGWQTHEDDKKNGWGVKDGMLVNTTTKTDFSPTGAYANLRTTEEFEDFWLHAEFLVEEKRNSGIYLRGMYEAQVVDRESPMQGIQGVGAIFGRIAPTSQAGNPGGQWQTYDLTLVDRHITVVLNGVKVIDNKPIIGPTAGAIYTNPSKPGPIYLQGDHTSVKYKNMYLAPVIKTKK